jgi:hypothetical protein
VYTPAPTKADVAGPVVPPVYVHLAASKGTALERATENDWSHVCNAPCDGYVPAFGTYRVAEADEHHSAPFTLPGPPGTRIALKVDDEGNVWTRDSVQLSAQRAQGEVSSAGWLVRHGLWRFIP